MHPLLRPQPDTAPDRLEWATVRRIWTDQPPEKAPEYIHEPDPWWTTRNYTRAGIEE